MQGRSPIVLMLRNHQFYEHASADRALAEAGRLSRVHGAECVVYAPVGVAYPPQPARSEWLTVPSEIEVTTEMAVTDGQAQESDEESPFRPVPDGGPHSKIDRYAAFSLVSEVLRMWPGEQCRVEELRDQAVARLGRPSWTLSAHQFPRVLKDMHRAGIVTVSDGFCSLVEQP